MTSDFNLGKASRGRLIGVHPRLVEVVELAIKLSAQDFSVHEGVRTLAKQKEYFARGASKTMNSMHLRQPDGNGHAVDLVPYLGGKLRWEWPLIYPIAAAVSKAASQLSVQVRWGGVWDRAMSAYGDSVEDVKKEVEAYCVRRPGIDFIDGPHFELKLP